MYVLESLQSYGNYFALIVGFWFCEIAEVVKLNTKVLMWQMLSWPRACCSMREDSIHQRISNCRFRGYERGLLFGPKICHETPAVVLGIVVRRQGLIWSRALQADRCTVSAWRAMRPSIPRLFFAWGRIFGIEERRRL